jgi:penicillin-binding protein 1A
MEVGSNLVKAMVGGSDFADSQYNRAVQAERQPGSAFKPIIYGVALQRAVTPADIIVDEPLKLPGSMAGKYWEPKNFSGEHYGRTTVWTGLVQSRNIVSIKLLKTVGVDSVRSLAGRMGITSELADNLSLALGTSGVSLLEMTTAYNVFAGEGIYRSPLFLTALVDRDGNVMEELEKKQEVRRALSPKEAYLVTDLLKGVIEHGTGRSAKGLSVESAGKTGTSDGNLDAWFIGYTPELAAGVWLGFDRNVSLGESETGGRAAAPIWHDFMEKANFIRPAGRKKFTVPDGVIFVPMDRMTGAIKNEESDATVKVAFKENLLPIK